MRRSKLVAAFALAGVLVGGTAALSTAQGASPTSEDAGAGTDELAVLPNELSLGQLEVDVPDDTDVPSGVTPDGRTYGPAPVPKGPGGGQVDPDKEVLPDLVSVVGDHGRSGYVVSKELTDDPGSRVHNPDEAAAYMRAQESSGPTRLPVYTTDSKTVIDTFTIN